MSAAVRIDESATLWSPDADERMPLLVLLHGYGADEHDLFALIPHLPEGLAVASVAAPLTPPFPAPGRAWFPLEGVHPRDGVRARDPRAVTDAAQALLDWVAETSEASRPVALLGFSQGAAVSLQALRLAPDRFGAVVALSGYAAPGALEHDADLRERRPPVFWGRGSNDDIIPAELVAHTAQWLPEHAELSGRVYPGLTHSISQEELADIAAFLQKWLDRVRPR